VDIEIVRPKDLTPELAAAWRSRMTREGGADSPFLSPEWANAVEDARGGRGVRVVVIRDAGEARAFMPVQTGQFTAIAAGGAMCDYEGVVGDPGRGFDPAAVVRALGVNTYDFAHVPAGQPAFARYAKGADRAWIVDLPEGYERYAAAQRASASALKEIDRKRRKVERELGELRFTALSVSQPDFERLVELKRGQYRATGQTDVLGVAWTQKLLQHLFDDARPGFGGGLFTLHIGGRLAAVHFHLMGARTIHAWIVAYEAGFERYSPGLILFQDILRWMDGQVWDRLDLGYGDYRFKAELSNAQQQLVRGFVGTPSAVALMRSAVYGVRGAAEALPLGRISELPGKAMRRLDVRRGLR
jgi:CelD/BcsL family acetyltransferase involved in cellulose biosynthesis